jgi:hypothetical protein
MMKQPQSCSLARFTVIVCALLIAVTGRFPVLAAEAAKPYSRVDGASVVAKLVRAYPEVVRAAPKSQSGTTDAVMVGKWTFAVDQRLTSTTFDERLNQADLIDQLSIPYPAGCPVVTPTVDEDPGRLRFDPFFSAVYGGSAKAVASNLKTVKWFGQTVQFTSVNGADRALQAVADELTALTAKQPELRKFVAPSAGTYNYRTIAGTKRLSMHAYGIAIDLNTAHSDYWRWDGVGTKPKYRNRIPCHIGEVFERHGFIWGAKWYHYDTMHFEYRPELLP